MTPGCPIFVSRSLRDRVGLLTFDLQSRSPTHEAGPPLTARHNHPIHSTSAAPRTRGDNRLGYPSSCRGGRLVRPAAQVYRAAAVGRQCAMINQAKNTPAAKWRKNTAHSAIRGIREIENQLAPGAKESNPSALGQFRENRPSPEGTTESITPASWERPVPKFIPFATRVLFACLRGRPRLRGQLKES
jgi:hypothetical protein